MQQNPQSLSNASIVRRNILLLGGIIAIAPFAIDAYLPAIPSIASSFSLSASQAEVSISLFLVFFAVGQFIGGPLADRKGRRPIILFGLLGFACSSLLLSLVQNFSLFLCLRLVQAIAGGMTTVACFSISRDAFSGKELGKVVSLITSVMLVAPMLAPFIGSVILLVANWHWIFVIMGIYALALSIIVLVRIPETLDKSHQPSSVIHSYKKVLGHKESLLLLCMSGLTMAVMFAFLTNSSSTYQEYFGLSPQVYSIVFGINVVGIIVLNNINIFLLKYFSMRAIMGVGLGLQLCASALLLITFQFAELWLFIPLTLLAVSSMGLVLPNAGSALMTLHPRDSGTANALAGLLRFFLGGVVGILPSLFIVNHYLPMASIMLFTAILGFGCWLYFSQIKTEHNE